VTAVPAEILGSPPHGALAGHEAHFALLDAETTADVTLAAPAVLATLRGGNVVYGAEDIYLGG
jgi:hypothetical protein